MAGTILGEYGMYGKGSNPQSINKEQKASNNLSSILKTKLDGALAGSLPKDLPHIIIRAGAGTGKTTTLVEGINRVLSPQKASKFQPTPEQAQIWEAMGRYTAAKTFAFCAFNKLIADELKRRMPERCEAMTLHSLGWRAVRGEYQGVRTNFDKTLSIFADILGMDPKAIKAKYPGRHQAVASLVSLCKLLLLPPSEDNLIAISEDYGIDLSALNSSDYSHIPAILEESRRVDKHGICDFDDMLWIPIANNLPVPRYDLLMVDEPQDMNACQQALAISSGRRLIVCGDPRQAIYQFAGADSKSMDRLETVLKESAPVLSLKLTVTRRCGKAIVAQAQRFVEDFTAHESNPEGEVLYMSRGVDKDDPDGLEHDGGGERVQDYIDQVKEGDMVICRLNAPLIRECFRMLKRKIRATIRGRNIGLNLVKILEGLRCSDVNRLEEALHQWKTAQEEKETSKRIPSEDKIQVIRDKADALEHFIRETINAFIDIGGRRATLDDIKGAITSMFSDDTGKGFVLLSTVHKVKGLESNRVFILNTTPKRKKGTEPEWADEAERNLKYVAITRAMRTLVWVTCK